MALSLALAACGGGETGTTPGGGDTGAAPTSVKIGFIGDLTGDNAAIVIPPRNGAQLAIDEYNAKNPKVKIELVPLDSKADPSTAANLAKTAITEHKVVGIIGPAFSGESQQVQPILEEAKIPSVSPSATRTALADAGMQFWHRVVANDDVQGPAAAEFVARAVKPKKAFVIDDKSAYGQGLGQAVQKALGSSAEVQTDSFEATATDFSSTVNKVAAFNPDFVFFGGYYAQAGPLLKQLRDKGIKAGFMSGDGSLHTQLIEGAGAEQAEGALLSCPCKIAYAWAAQDENSKKFTDTFKSKFSGQLPEIYATEGYDAASAFIKAIEAGNTDPVKINDFLKTVDFQGLGKQVKFTDKGEVEDKNVYIYQVKGGEIVSVGNSTEATIG
ncbi:branched-chain amino acid ABC transporter substrate-binding protein [Planobispora longispora]|uniref:branched-chain amino acid ABC transporter substrate-binding protein n=1 Tax=Planobispora longispora TaxID=28887 RepID=UPI0023B2FBAC|nr:branched-chain amino acid ABC transporter substrate-binding protein [Planobispora longispora]